MAIETKQLHALSKIYKEAVYGGAKKEAPKDTRMVVTAADKKANTKAYQNMKAGVKGYKAADHLKTEDAKYGYDKDGNSLNPKDKKAKKDYDGDGKVESGTDEYKGSVDKAIKKAMKKESFSNWRHDLKEIPDYDQIPTDAKDRNKKIEEKKVKNSVKINPNMEESVGSAIDKTLGAAGEVADTAIKLPAKAIGYAKGLKKGMKKAAKKGEDKASGDASPKHESYEATKTKEVMTALKKRDLKKDVKKKIAADIVKKKGDTSKSDDRYSYESKLWDQVAANLTELGEMNDARFKVEGYQRDPEKGEAAAKKADTRSAKQKRMDSPDKGINSPAFKEFMKQYGG